METQTGTGDDKTTQTISLGVPIKPEYMDKGNNTEALIQSLKKSLAGKKQIGNVSFLHRHDYDKIEENPNENQAEGDSHNQEDHYTKEKYLFCDKKD